MIRGEEKKVMFRGKKILVVGLARSGAGAANLLSSFGAEVCVTDIKSRDFLRDNIKKLLPSIKIMIGKHPPEIFNAADLIVVSPGVPLDIPPLAHAKAKGIPVIGELELAYQVIQSGLGGQGSGGRRQNTEHRAQTLDSRFLTPKFIGITGTNGKSTTTILIDMMLKKAGFRTILGGNIGNALTEEILKIVTSGQRSVRKKEKNSSLIPHPSSLDYIVTEVSSFQLESIRDFRPFIALILNITPDHLDRYSSIQEYIDAKARIFENQGAGDYLILNADDPIVMKLYNSKRQIPDSKLRNVEILFFSRKKEVEGIYCRDGSLVSHFLSTSRTAPSAFLRKQDEGAVSSLIAVDEIKIKGVHNLENAMAASLAAFICGCDIEAIRSVLKDFSGLEHRLEFVCEVDGISFINDSKGTNVGAVVKSLESFQNVILIMGGRDKNGDFRSLKDLIKSKVKALILLGESREKIAKIVGKVTETIFVNNLKEAVGLSMLKASTGDVVLLSPGCTSFDMFADFEDRGKKFKEAVMEIKNARIRY